MPWKRSGRSEIVHIVVTGYQKKKAPNKHYVFVIDITWNNSERFEIYRRYSDFFSFQTTLKALFPAAAGRKNDTRVIPQLPKRIFVGRSHVAKVAEARLEQLNRYCQTLISLEPMISESVHVIGFFSPRSTDKPLPKLHLHRPASLHPLKVPAGSLFEEFCALAEYLAEDDSQISFKAGDKVLVLSKDDSGWWMCSVDGTVGWAPPSYLKKCDNGEGDSDSDDEYISVQSYIRGKDSDDSGHDSESTPPHCKPQGFKAPEIDAEEYKAIDSYEAEGPGQVGFEAGSTVHVLDKMEDGWWFVSNGVDEGWAPCSYLENSAGCDEAEVAVSSLDVEKYISLEDYEAEEDDEMTFQKGVTMDVLQKRLDGWWLVKLNSTVGLAPATYLQKTTAITTASSEDEQLFRKVNVASNTQQPEFPMSLNNKQPPRKQSVRYRASMKTRSKNAMSSSPLLAEATRPLSPVLSEAGPATIRPHPPKRPTPPPKSRSPSPVSSESDPESPKKSSKPKASPRMRRGLESRIKKFEPPNRRNSDSSENSYPNTPTKQEQLVKKTSVPDMSPKPMLKLANKSVSIEEGKKAPQPPPRPYKPTETRPPVIPRINEELLSDTASVTGPNRPARPRGSEIRRAKERNRSHSPRTEGDDASSVMSYSSVSSSEVSNKSPPKLPKKKNSTSESGSPSLLPPPVPRRKSTSDAPDESVAPPLSSPPQKPDSSNPLSQQMADTLIKYILASDDPELKNELKKIITSNPEVMSSLQQ